MSLPSYEVIEVIPLFKKNEPSDKTNHRPISLFPLISKIFPKVLYEKIE